MGYTVNLATSGSTEDSAGSGDDWQACLKDLEDAKGKKTGPNDIKGRWNISCRRSVHSIWGKFMYGFA